MIDAADFYKWLQVFGVKSGGGGGGAVTQYEVQQSAFNYGILGGVNDIFTITLTPAPIGYTENLIISAFSGTLQNLTTSPTLNVNGLGALPITLWGGLVVAPDDIAPNSSYLLLYNTPSNTFQILNPSVSTANTLLVQSNFYNSGTDNGAANAYNINLIPAYDASFPNGFPIYLTVGIGHTNTGASTLTVNGTTKPIYLQNGAALSAGMMIENTIYYLLYSDPLDGWVLMNPEYTSSAWVNVIVDTMTLQPDMRYACNNGATPITFTLPVSAPLFTEIEIAGYSAGGWSITQNAGQSINLGSMSTTVSSGGLASNNANDYVKLLCVQANTTWNAIDSMGNISIL